MDIDRRLLFIETTKYFFVNIIFDRKTVTIKHSLIIYFHEFVVLSIIPDNVSVAWRNNCITICGNILLVSFTKRLIVADSIDN